MTQDERLEVMVVVRRLWQGMYTEDEQLADPGQVRSASYYAAQAAAELLLVLAAE